MSDDISNLVLNIQKLASRIRHLEITPFKNTDGWILDSRVWTYASAITFSVSGDVVSCFPVGTKIKLTQTTAKYFYVVGAAYLAPDTTVTLTGGSDYSLANAVITGPFYSYVSNPQGFPQWFNWIPTLTGFAADPTNCVYRFCISNKICHLMIRQATMGTSNLGTFTITTPVVASTIVNAYWGSMWWGAKDNSVTVNPSASVYLGSGSSIINVIKDMISTAWTSSNGKSVNFELDYEIG